jgi:hypothetical protein
MATAPSVGNRIPVKLPFKGATDNEPQFTSIKEPIAKFLKFEQATDNDLEYLVKVFKKNKNGETGQGAKVTIKRRRRPGYRQRSIKVTFQMGHPAGNGRKSTLTGKKVKIGSASFASIQFPITKSVLMDDVIKYFETGAGASLKALKVTDVNSGQSYPILRKR